MTKSSALRLQRIVVEGLFNTYNHEIDLNLSDRVTLLHGPNGVGKTFILRMTNALLGQTLDYFRHIPFTRFAVQFHDGSTLELEATERTNNRNARYMLTLARDNKSRTARVSAEPGADTIAAKVRFLRPHGDIPQTWIDIRDGETLSAAEVVSRYSDSPSARGGRDGGTPTWYRDIVANARAHLIEEQRLMRLMPASGSQEYISGRTQRTAMKSTVDEYSRDFRRRLADTMAEYGRQSQSLDQSFPQRLMSAEEELDVHELQNRMSELDRRTAEFKRIGVLDMTPAHPFSASSFEKLDHTQARVMTLYVRDTEEKLSALGDLATRAHLLLDSVNDKYRHKRIQLDRERGLVATSDNGQPLPLSGLSSGEQQELVLHYDLLFKVPSNTIVLIDEPELSLHVAWQKRFLPDLLEIVKLSSLDALVATHSPFVVGDRTDLMVGLGESA